MAKYPKALRKCIQAGWGILTNAYVNGFLPGAPVIYQGGIKQVCVPGMNCYSCPGALGSCPIGAIVGLVDDVTVDNSLYLEEAQEIVEQTGVTYTNLRAWDNYYDVLSSVGTPTTYFVDSEGKLIGEPILGARPNQYKKQMEEYLSQAE